MIKRLLVTAVLASQTLTPAQASDFHGKTDGMSGAGSATSDFVTGIALSPTALANFKDSQGFNVQFNAGALVSDQDSMVDTSSDLSDRLSLIKTREFNVEDAQFISQSLRSLVDTHATIDGGASLYLSMPTPSISLGLFARTDISVGIVSGVSSADIEFFDDVTAIGLIAQQPGITNAEILAAAQQRLQDKGGVAGNPRIIAAVEAVAGGQSVDAQILGIESTVYASGAAVSQVGLNLSSTLNEGSTLIGISLKGQRVDLIDYLVDVDNFDENDFDADDFRTQDNGTNIDLGLVHSVGRWSGAVSLIDLISADYTSAMGRTVSIDPLARLGVGYNNGWLQGALDIDANARANYATGGDSQFVRAGVQFDAWGWAQVRLGYKTDMKSQIDDTASIGLGFSPFGMINIDVAAIAGANDTAGGSVRLGLTF